MAADSSSSSSDSDEEDVQLSDFQPGQAGRVGASAYSRVIPDRFSADSDDLFMRSVLKNYAIEGETEKTHIPTGVFYLNETNARELAKEVLGTHKGLTGKALDDYLASYWSKAWGHFDVNRTG